MSEPLRAPTEGLLEKLEEIVTYHLGDSDSSSMEIADAFRQAEHSLAYAFAWRDRRIASLEQRLAEIERSSAARRC